MRLAIAIAAALGIGLAVPAAAQAPQESVPDLLQRQGYEILQIHWTWLGRIRIVAETDELYREIVISPDTGEILRDYATTHAELDERRASLRERRERRSRRIETTAAVALDDIDNRMAEPSD